MLPRSPSSKVRGSCPELHKVSGARKTPSLAPRFSGVGKTIRHPNRFSGFWRAAQTAEAVLRLRQSTITPLKQGVNENGELHAQLPNGLSRLGAAKDRVQL